MTPTNNDLHISLDIETLGTVPGSVILSIGAVAWRGLDLERALVTAGSTFYTAIDVDYSLREGMTTDASTMRWWMDQPAAARLAAFSSDGLYPYDALMQFMDWLDAQRSRHTVTDEMITDEIPFQIWANDPSFDIALITSACRVWKIDSAIHRRSHRCYRTLKAYGLIDQPRVTSVSMLTGIGDQERIEQVPLIPHHALHDAIHQAYGILTFLRNHTH